MKRKLMSLILALAMLCSLFVPAMATEETPAYVIPDVKGKLVILHTNDTHGADVTYRAAVDGKENDRNDSIGIPGVAQLKKDFEAAGADVLLLSAGDSIQGSPLVSESKGKTAFEYMNAAGYDAMALGNHEMDYGYANLKELIKIAEFPVMGANVLDEATKKPVLESNKIFTTASGLKVGVFGLATPETLTKADPSKMKGVAFSANPEELYATAKAQVEALKKDGAEFIICLGHLGVDESSAGYRSNDVCNNVEGIDLFVDGHSHTVIKEGQPQSKDAKVNTYPSFENKSNTMIVSTGEKLANVGVVIYDKTSKNLSSSLVSVNEYTKFDAELQKTIKAEYDRLKAILGVPFAKSEIQLNGDKAPGNRTMETNLGDFATDALLWQARKTYGEDKVDAALTNGGGIRSKIAAGDISMWDLKTVFPFGNVLTTIDVTGAQLLEALEAATYCTPDSVGAFPQISGINFIINTAVEYTKGDLYKASTYYAPAKPGSRVTIITVNDKPFDKDATYTIATNDFTANGGDTYCVFKDAKNVKMTSTAMEDALVNYTKDVLGGTVTAEKYGTTGERILIIPDDVKTDVWYTEAVHYAIGEGIMVGAGGKFNPSGTVTRATVIEMLYKLEGKPTEGLDKAAFNDLEGKWYSNSAHWAAFIGIVKGQADGGFHGDDVITRAELAQIIADYAKYAEITVDTTGMAMKEAGDYDKIPAEYLEGMTFCYYAKLMTGNQSGLLLPGDNLTRDALAQIMFNFAKLPVPAAKAA